MVIKIDKVKDFAWVLIGFALLLVANIITLGIIFLGFAIKQWYVQNSDLIAIIIAASVIPIAVIAGVVQRILEKRESRKLSRK